jgi:hypothetical protein
MAERPLCTEDVAVLLHKYIGAAREKHTLGQLHSTW